MALHKYCLLVDLGHKVIDRTVSRHDADVKLKEIGETPDPFGPVLTLFAYVAAGGSVAYVLGGAWWDILVASIGGALCYACFAGFDLFLPSYSMWCNLISAFLAHPEINVTIATLSSVAIPLPGFTVSLGAAELVDNQVVDGVSRFVQGIVTLLWQTLGAWLGYSLVASLYHVRRDSNSLASSFRTSALSLFTYCLSSCQTRFNMVILGCWHCLCHDVCVSLLCK